MFENVFILRLKALAEPRAFSVLAESLLFGEQSSEACPKIEISDALQFPVFVQKLRVTRGAQASEKGVVEPDTSQQTQEARAYGDQLFETVFPESIRKLYNLARERTASDPSGRSLRIFLDLTLAPSLANAAWELMRDRDNGYLFLDRRSPVVRCLRLRQRSSIALFDQTKPLRILVHIATPRGTIPLDVRREVRLLDEALEPLRNHVRVDRTPDGSFNQFAQAIRESRYDIVHFIGHGLEPDEKHSESALLFETERRRDIQRVSAEQLAQSMTGLEIKVVVLNACYGGASTQTDPYSGFAQALVSKGDLPSAIGMQIPVSDRGAIDFSRTLYWALRSGASIDNAVVEARQTMLASNPDGLEWITPVLYMDRQTAIAGADMSTALQLDATLANDGPDHLVKALEERSDSARRRAADELKRARLLLKRLKPWEKAVALLLLAAAIVLPISTHWAQLSGLVAATLTRNHRIEPQRLVVDNSVCNIYVSGSPFAPTTTTLSYQTINANLSDSLGHRLQFQLPVVESKDNAQPTMALVDEIGSTTLQQPCQMMRALGIKTTVDVSGKAVLMSNAYSNISLRFDLSKNTVLVKEPPDPDATRPLEHAPYFADGYVWIPVRTLLAVFGIEYTFDPIRQTLTVTI